MYKFLLPVLLFLNLVICVSADELPRVKVADGTLVAPDGRPLRGASFFMDLYGVEDMRENEEKYREYFQSIFEPHDLNCVRIGAWMGDWKYDIAGDEKHRTEYLYVIDKAVDWCEDSGVYAIVNLHIRYKTTVELQKAKAFWSVIAPRYKDRKHVIYELTNEPEPKSSLQHTPAIYAHVKSLAPQTHQILYSHVAATQLKVDELKSATKDVDFTNASVGFHCYDNVLMNTIQWDHAQKLRAAGFPIICTEFLSLTNNNDMPIDYKNLMHCMMRAEERKMAWISWGPFAQYRNPNKKDWIHNALRYSPDLEAAKFRYGIDFRKSPQWPDDGIYRIKSLGTDHYLARTSDNGWQPVRLSADVDDQTLWRLKRFDGNMVHLFNPSARTQCLHGKFDDDRTWQKTVTADFNNEWNSQKFQLQRTGKNTYQICCRWGDLFLTADEDGTITTAPMNHQLGQHWELIAK